MVVASYRRVEEAGADVEQSGGANRGLLPPPVHLHRRLPGINHTVRKQLAVTVDCCNLLGPSRDVLRAALGAPHQHCVRYLTSNGKSNIALRYVSATYEMVTASNSLAAVLAVTVVR